MEPVAVETLERDAAVVRRRLDRRQLGVVRDGRQTAVDRCPTYNHTYVSRSPVHY